MVAFEKIQIAASMTLLYKSNTQRYRSAFASLFSKNLVKRPTYFVIGKPFGSKPSVFFLALIRQRIHCGADEIENAFTLLLGPLWVIAMFDISGEWSALF